MSKYIDELTEKTSVVNADCTVIVDSADTNKNKKVSFSTIWTYINNLISSAGYTKLTLGTTNTTAGYGDESRTAFTHSVSAHAPVSAEQNVQSNWTEASTTSDAYILNKPTSLTPSAHGSTHTNGTDNIAVVTTSTSGLMSTADKTKLDAITGTNTGNQTSIVGISGTITQFNTACTDADFASGGGTATGANTGDETTSTIKTKLGISVLSGSNTGDETSARLAGIVNNTDEIGTGISDADKMVISNGSASHLNWMTWNSIKKTLKSYFDTLYCKLLSADVANKILISSASLLPSWKNFADSTYNSVLNKVSFLNSQGNWSTPGGETNSYSVIDGFAVGQNNSIDNMGSLAVGSNVNSFNNNQLLQGTNKVANDAQNMSIVHSQVMRATDFAQGVQQTFSTGTAAYLYLRDANCTGKAYVGQVRVRAVFLASDTRSVYSSIEQMFDIISYNGTNFSISGTIATIYSANPSNITMAYSITMQSGRASLYVKCTNNQIATLVGTAYIDIVDILIAGVK